MHQTTDNWVKLSNMPPEFRSAPVLSLAEVVAFARRRRSVILLTGLATFGVAILYLVIASPTFTARAELVVAARANAGDAASVSTIVESQIGIIKSENIASAVIGRLGLAEDPEFAWKESALRGLTSGLVAKLGLAENPAFAGHDSVLGGLARSTSRLLGWSKPETEANARRYVVESFERKLSAKRVGPTYLVEITFDSADPDRAAQIINAVAEKYITYQMDDRSLEDETWVKDRLEELSNQASAAQRALEDHNRNGKDASDSDDARDKLVAAAESSKKAYENLRHVLRKMEATRQQSPPVFEASLVTEASPPLRATWPKVKSVLGISIVAGLLLGVAIGMLRDLSGRSIAARGEETRRSSQEDRAERPVLNAARPDRLSEASLRLTDPG
jgi:uncharacterized protein involved in exopolysaccharide biosynthesis